MDDKEINAKLKACKTPEELKAVAKEIGYELSDEEALIYFNEIAKSGELGDDELSNVSGGKCSRWRRGRAYSSYPPHYLIVTSSNYCKFYKTDSKKIEQRMTRYCCEACVNSTNIPQTSSLYCKIRTYDNDPLNPKD